MALSPADFYAYSQATGAPIPNDPSERAQMAPEVLAFRRNQLKAPQQEEKQGFDPLSVGVGVGLALAGGVGAGLGIRRLMRGPKQSANAGVRQANLERFAEESSPVRRVVEETQVAPSKTVAPTTIQSTEVEPEYVSPYSKGPTYRDVYPSRFEFPKISEETLAARRQLQQEQAKRTQQLAPGTYQLELGGEVSPTLRQLRSSEFGPNLTEVRREALGLAEEQAPAIPISAAPNQLDIFKYTKEAERDIAQELVDEYVRNVDLEGKRQQKIQRDVATQKEGMAMRVIDQLREEAKQERLKPQGFNPRQYIEQTGAVSPVEDLTSLQQLNEGQVIDQKINAVESGEDQMTGRMRQQLQRNEDLNLNQIDALEDVTGNIDTVISQLPDGVLFDQAEGIDLATGKRFLVNPPRPSRGGLNFGQSIQLEQNRPDVSGSSAARFLERERAEIASQLGEQGFSVSPSRVEAELTNRLTGSEAWTYGPKYTQRKQALQLGATYEPAFFENLKTPSVRIAGETIPTEMLKEPVTMADTAERLQEQVNKKRNWLGQVRLEEQKNKVRLMNVDKNINQLENYKNEITSFLSSGRATSEQARLGKKRLSDVSLDLDRLDTYRNELMQDVYSGEKRIQGARSYTESAIANLQLPQKLKSGIEEGQRVFFETDVTGQVIPETMELRSERPMITTERKGGSGRNLAEFTVPERIDEEIRAIQGGGRIRDYDPETGAPVQRWQSDTADVGRVIDIYGIRPSSEFAADPEMRPSKPYPSKKPLTQEPTPERIASVELSEGVRKAADPQAFLQQKMREAGISAIGQFSPWPRRSR